jgi:hypothetical protein
LSIIPVSGENVKEKSGDAFEEAPTVLYSAWTKSPGSPSPGKEEES